MPITPPLFSEDEIVTKITDYAINTPDFMINFIQNEIKKRDVRGLTRDRITAINITGEHPLVSLTENSLSGNELNTSGYLPAIAVTESTENESYESLGDGQRIPLIMDQSFVDDCRVVPLELRVQEGLVSDNQLALIEQAITNNKTIDPTGQGAVLALLDGFYLQESVFVSVWCHSVDERNIIGNIMRSILYDMKKALRERKVKDIHLQTSKGLVNFDFGRVLYGQETTINYINFFHNITVVKEFPRKILLDNCEKISIFDAIQQSTIELCKSIDVDPRFRALGHPDEGLANIFEGDVE